MDLAPSGYLSLREAFDRFRYRLWKGEDPVADLHSAVAAVQTSEAFRMCAEIQAISDNIVKAFAKALTEGRLRVIARDSKSRGFVSISPREVSLAHFPERLLMTEKIARGHSKYLDDLIGRTAMVPEEQFATFMESFLGEFDVTESVRKFVEILSSPIAGAIPETKMADLLQRLTLRSPSVDGQTPTRRKRPGKQAAVEAKLRELHPAGVPAGQKGIALLEEIRTALPHIRPISTSTLQRAIKNAYRPPSN
ncbi:hypothetical protein ABMA32_05845 [Mesorhizobium sp. VNQ89]|uniref:hypothetical protein n=1 Tax=Mesorhizobium quangtriensis TaxID=3157709 RepID=UPI0032B85456